MKRSSMLLANFLLVFAFALATPVATPVAHAQSSAEVGEAPAGRNAALRLANLMEQRYVYPEVGGRYARDLRAHAEAGVYDRLTGEALARRLLADLERTHPDDHLNVVEDRPSARDDEAGALMPADETPHVEAAGWLAPGIAFVRFNLFPSEPDNIAAVARFMDEHAEARVIIFDVRTHRGGALGEIDEIFGRLFDEPTRMLTMATRRSMVEIVGMPPTDDPRLRLVSGDPEFISLEHWALPDATRPHTRAEIYVLTSNRTSSAAEHFALGLQATGRATLIGAKTDGANHFGGLEQVAEGISAFIPVGRTFDPRNGRDWEGEGVTPDIMIEPEEALIKALELEGVPITRARALSAEVAPNRSMRWPVSAAPAAQSPNTELRYDESGRPVISTQVNGQGPFDMVIDTAAQTTFVAQGLVEELQIAPLSSDQTISGAGGQAQVQAYSISNFTSDLFSVDGALMPALPNASVTQARGVIGMDLFLQRRLVFDREAGRLFSSESGATDVELVPVAGRTIGGNFIIVPVMLDGVIIQAVVDSGAARTIVNDAARAALGFLVNDPRLSQTHAVRGATDDATEAQRSSVAAFAIGPAEFEDVPVTFSNLPVFGMLGLADEPALILGSDVLNLLPAYALDFARGELQVRLPDPPATARPLAR